jgi:microcin C transport system ATP-binding protein
VIEQGPAEQMFAARQQTYTRQLLEAAFMAPTSAD